MEGRFVEMESRNLERDGRILKFEEGFEAFKLEVAGQFSKLHDLISSRLNRVDLEEGSGKRIMGLAPSGSAGSSRQQSYSNSTHKVTSDSVFKPPKLNFPKFGGIDPKAWIQKVEARQQVTATTIAGENCEHFDGSSDNREVFDGTGDNLEDFDGTGDNREDFDCSCTTLANGESKEATENSRVGLRLTGDGES
ncbi:hypothetical protein EZV62_018470 [Acer yangbiense]|uniref:Uncharacterized protein n=1 Tax=Acer yangbiense TaxID=1000413 RepID=A0A5C7HJG8_9ROSI|nr:hypothetical protein EZV62_018470 [Acer yangbiense]